VARERERERERERDKCVHDCELNIKKKSNKREEMSPSGHTIATSCGAVIKDLRNNFGPQCKVSTAKLMV